MTQKNFYQTNEWRSLRKVVLDLYGDECMNCHTTPNITGKSSHVDHIVPRSINYNLELVLSNMQVLCEHCNCSVKKTDIIDFRTATHIKLLENKIGRRFTILQSSVDLVHEITVSDKKQRIIVKKQIKKELLRCEKKKLAKIKQIFKKANRKLIDCTDTAPAWITISRAQWEGLTISQRKKYINNHSPARLEYDRDVGDINSTIKVYRAF